jgi:hypothetical protein
VFPLSKLYLTYTLPLVLSYSIVLPVERLLSLSSDRQPFSETTVVGVRRKFSRTVLLNVLLSLKTSACTAHRVFAVLVSGEVFFVCAVPYLFEVSRRFCSVHICVTLQHVDVVDAFLTDLAEAVEMVSTCTPSLADRSKT